MAKSFRNLRDLKDTEDQFNLRKRTTTVSGTTATTGYGATIATQLLFDPTNPIHTNWGNGWGAYKPDGWTMFFAGDCYSDQCADDSYRQWSQGFCVYPGVTELTFEIWGGGGGGAGACNCQQGNPGGAGAYSRKTLYGCDFPGGTLGGYCYLVCIARTTGCSACCEGNRGCKTFVTGCGLTNFCADGGLPGKTCCCAFVEEAVAGVGTAPKFGAQCYGRNWGCHTFSPTGFQWCDCACAYGGDLMIGGKLGWFRVSCACGDTCLTRLGIAQPGGFRDQCTRYFITNNFGNACANCYNWTKNGEWPGLPNTCSGGGMPGQGGPSATACAGSCCYGLPGHSGLVKVTYK